MRARTPARRRRRGDARRGALVAQEPLRLPLRPALLGRGAAPDHHPRPAARRCSRPQPGERLLEIGPGTGYYTLDMAEWVGPEGTVEIFDLQQEFLDHTMRRAAERGLGERRPDPGRRHRAPLRGRLDRRRRPHRRARRDPRPRRRPARDPPRAASPAAAWSSASSSATPTSRRSRSLKRQAAETPGSTYDEHSGNWFGYFARLSPDRHKNVSGGPRRLRAAGAVPFVCVRRRPFESPTTKASCPTRSGWTGTPPPSSRHRHRRRWRWRCRRRLRWRRRWSPRCRHRWRARHCRAPGRASQPQDAVLGLSERDLGPLRFGGGFGVAVAFLGVAGIGVAAVTSCGGGAAAGRLGAALLHT